MRRPWSIARAWSSRSQRRFAPDHGREGQGNDVAYARWATTGRPRHQKGRCATHPDGLCLHAGAGGSARRLQHQGFHRGQVRTTLLCGQGSPPLGSLWISSLSTSSHDHPTPFAVQRSSCFCPQVRPVLAGNRAVGEVVQRGRPAKAIPKRATGEVSEAQRAPSSPAPPGVHRWLAQGETKAENSTTDGSE